MELLEYLESEADKLHEENFSSSDEFRTVNHSFVEGFNYALAIVQGFEVKLNPNQQVVLEWLKSDDHPNYSNIFDLFSDLLDYQVPVEVGEAFTEMMTDSKQQFQVLAAFAEWGLKQ